MIGNGNPPDDPAGREQVQSRLQPAQRLAIRSALTVMRSRTLTAMAYSSAPPRSLPFRSAEGAAGVRSSISRSNPLETLAQRQHCRLIPYTGWIGASQ